MKRLMMTTALIAMAATAGHAQTGTTTPMNDETFLSGPGIESFRASDFIGMRVYSMEEASDAVSYDGIQDNWEDIGEINDVVLSRDGRIDAVPDPPLKRMIMRACTMAPCAVEVFILSGMSRLSTTKIKRPDRHFVPRKALSFRRGGKWFEDAERREQNRLDGG